ncbi:MAG: hypothetical protein QFX37_00735 [Archaeoglobales archaeon]|nr:hypothetical protein [Archaeoglobales archaeon]
MPKALKSGKKAGMIMAVIITIITIGTAIAAPLDIVIEEKVNTTVSPSGDSATGSISFEYTTNVIGYVNITNKADEAIYDIWVAVKLVNNSTGCSLFHNGSSSAVNISNTASNFVPDKINKAGVFNTTGANCFIHIPLLKPNEIVSVFYDVNDAAMGINDGAPFTITETYDPSKIPARGEYTWKVTMQAELNTSWFEKTAIDLTGKTVYLDIKKFLSNDPNHYGSNNWVSLGPISGPSESTTGSDGYGTKKPDTLTIAGKQLSSSNPSYEFSFDVTGNYTNSTASPYYFEPFGFAVFSFEVEGNISGTQIVDVFAVGNASINVTKYGPNATNYWFGNASVTNTASGLTYVLTNVTMWATEQNNFQNVISGSSYEWKPGVTLNTGDSWNTSQGSPQGISFQYNQVPIIWANATFKLIKDSSAGWDFSGSQTLNDTKATYGSNFIVVEKIYIIGTYLVKVTKHVLYNSTASTDTNNVFDIYLVVENIGGEESPYVYVYDLIPDNFEKYQWNGWTDDSGGDWVKLTEMYAGFGSQLFNSLFMDTYKEGYYWRLMPIAYGANGDGDYNDNTEINNKQTVVIFYQLAGSGDFKVLDAFIVGIDPMYSLNEQTSPKITLVSGAKATSYENTLATIAFAGVGALILFWRRNGNN